MDYDCLVVGAGIGGLSAAYELSRSGLRVLVIEADIQVGGVMRSERTPDGFLLEHGPNTVTSNDPALHDHFSSLGIAAEKLVAKREGARRYVLHSGALLPIPMSPPAFLRSRLLSGRAKLRMFAELLLPRSPASDESVAAFFIRRLGPEPFERLIDPFISGVYAGDPRALSARASFARLWAAEQRAGSIVRGMLAGGAARKPKPARRTPRELFSFRAGLAAWPQALADQLGPERLWLGARAVALRQSPDGWELAVQRPGQIDPLTARHVLLAVPAQVAASLIEPYDQAAATALRGIAYPPVSIVHLGYRREAVAHPIDGFGMLCPASEGRRVLGTLWPSALFPGRAPEGAILTSSFVGGARYPDLARQSDEALIEQVHAEQQALIGAREEPMLARVMRWSQAIPQYNAGHIQRLATLEHCEARLAGLHLLGNYRDGVSVERAWQRGREQAQLVAAALQPAAYKLSG
jgi:protoporphyrinogen/coproporphyrinogen III oxidase